MLLEREVGNFLWKVPSEVGKFLLKIESFTKIGKHDRFLSRIGCSISIDFSNFGCTFQLRLELSNFILSNFISNLPTSRSFKLPFSTTRISKACLQCRLYTTGQWLLQLLPVGNGYFRWKLSLVEWSEVAFWELDTCWTIFLCIYGWCIFCDEFGRSKSSISCWWLRWVLF